MDTEASQLVPCRMVAFIFHCPVHGLRVAHCRASPKLSHSKDSLVSGPAPTVGRKDPISLIVADRQISGFSGYSLGILGSVSGNKDLIEDIILDTHPIIFSIVVHARAGKDTQQLSRMDTQRI